MTYSIDTSHASPNHSSRDGVNIAMILLHATVGSGPSALAWLCNPQPNDPNARVSTHYLVYKTGTIYQLVEDSEAAWHAGVSSWMGLSSAQIQKCSIGIELENDNDGRDPYPTVQLDAARWLCAHLIAKYHIAQPMLTRHLDVAIPRGRKTDPAGFPWAAFFESLYPHTPAPPPPPASRAYQVVGLPIYQRQDLAGPLAGTLPSGETVLIDATYSNGGGHLKDGRGFVDMDGLKAL